MIVQKSLVEMACDEIKRQIAHGELVAGDRIREIEFSERLGVSRPPLREALRTLATQHILELSPRRGYRVVGLSREDAEELFSMRVVLEEFGLKLMYKRLAQVDFSRLRETVDRMCAAAAQGDEQGVGDMHQEFHIRLVELSGHQRLVQTYKVLMSAMELYMARSVASEAAIGALNESAQRHVELLDAIESRDKRRIAEQMRTHEAIYTVAEVPPIRDEGAELATTGAA